MTRSVTMSAMFELLGYLFCVLGAGYYSQSASAMELEAFGELCTADPSCELKSGSFSCKTIGATCNEGETCTCSEAQKAGRCDCYKS